MLGLADEDWLTAVPEGLNGAPSARSQSSTLDSDDSTPAPGSPPPRLPFSSRPPHRPVLGRRERGAEAAAAEGEEEGAGGGRGGLPGQGRGARRRRARPPPRSRASLRKRTGTHGKEEDGRCGERGRGWGADRGQRGLPG